MAVSGTRFDLFGTSDIRWWAGQMKVNYMRRTEVCQRSAVVVLGFRPNTIYD